MPRFEYETLAGVQGKIAYGPMDSKPDIITPGAMMTKTDGLDAREGMLGVPAPQHAWASDSDVGGSVGTSGGTGGIDRFRARASGFGRLPAATPSPCEEIPW